MRILSNPGGPADYLEFSADGRWLLAAREEACVWTLPEGELHRIECPKLKAACLAGPGVALVFGQKVRVVGLPPDEVIGTADKVSTDYGQVAFSERAGRIACPSPEAITLVSWPSPRGVTPWPLRGKGLIGIKTLRFSPDGGGLATADRHPQVAIWDVESGAIRWRAAVPGSEFFSRLAFSPDGRLLAVASGVFLTLIAAESGETVAQVRLKRKFYLDIAFTPDGRFLAGVSNEKTVKVYETSTWSLRHELAWDLGSLRSIAFSADGMLGAVSNAGKKVLVWDIDW